MSAPQPIDPQTQTLIEQVARQLHLTAPAVAAAVGLFGGGATVPFVARYRKEATGGLDEQQLRDVQTAHAEAKALADRRTAILNSLAELGVLTPALETAVRAAADRATLEDVYLPYRPKRRTRAQVAREKGLEPLALRILSQPLNGQPQREAQAFVDADKGVGDTEAALAGARDIVAENVSERAEIRADLRAAALRHGRVACKKKRGELPAEAQKFRDYFDHTEAVAQLPSHRYLAMCRGETEGALAVDLQGEDQAWQAEVLRRIGHQPRSPFGDLLREAVADGWERLLWPAITSAVRGELKERADREAISVFAQNLGDLLLAAPLGPQPVLGLDPGLRTGCKLVAVDAQGRHLHNTVLYLVQGEASQARAQQDLLRAIDKYKPVAIAVGNGTGGREAEAFAKQALRDANLAKLPVVMVSEAGASVYSASELARAQHPELDVTVRGSLSIARRLQDPLAELVQIEAKAIGVGQYQHDVDQAQLEQKLSEVVESCVNRVGVELNTASASLLQHVAGIGPSLAKKIVAHRDEAGPFASRQALLKVKGLGPKAFEQAAGFLRIRGGNEPLDASAVHPERYAVVRQMARDLKTDVAHLIGNHGVLQQIDTKHYVAGDVGEPTVRDIVSELDKPGRDPRQQFEVVQFRDDVRTMADLTPGMRLPGIVTNVAAFGAFVDLGVHQDGLVHVSQLADRFVKDPREVVTVGQRVEVTVVEVDLARKRIALTMKQQKI
jgi:uncharacterized protein